MVPALRELLVQWERGKKKEKRKEKDTNGICFRRVIRAWQESRARYGPKKGRAQLVGEDGKVLTTDPGRLR